MKTWTYSLSCVALLAGLLSHSAFAQDAQSTIKAEDLKEKNKAPGQDVDDVITNNMMRAASGSKSRWSLNSALNYNGGSVEKPLAEDRPNISAATGTTEKAALLGQVSTKYNITQQRSLAAGVGIRWLTPLNGKPTNYNGDRFDADNPYITYQYLYKWSGVQSIFQFTPQAYSNSNLVRLGYVGAVAVSQDNLYEVGHTGLSVGLYVAVQGAAYNKSGSIGNPGEDGFVPDVRAQQSDYLFNIDPYMEYQITDKVNLRTVSNLWNYEHIRNEPRALTFQWDKVYQSVGVGISVTRDIFVYPNLQFLPDNIRSDRTNVALNTNINLF